MIVLVRSHARTPASDLQVAQEVSSILQRRAALDHPPASLAISDAVALGIAAQFRSPTATGKVMEYFLHSGAIDSRELIQAAQFEQDYASPEGHAALYCLIGWARSRAARLVGSEN